MRRLLALALLATFVAGPAADAAGSFTKKTYRASDGRSRDYWLYVPPKPRPRMPLLVFLHGCIQTADGAARATRFNALAERRGFLVVYPQQTRPVNSSYPLTDGNGSGCWNWFLPDHQARGAGEPALIAGLTREVMRARGADPQRVYLVGISAGADMAAIMGATYPDLYAAIGVIAGCAYATCSDVTGQLAYRAMGTRARVVPVFWAQGSTDTLNVLPMGLTALSQWLGTNDLADDGAMNGSVSRAPVEVEHRALDQTPEPLSGDPCVHNNSWTCPGGMLGFDEEYPHTIARYADAGGCVVVESWLIHGLTHAYPGAKAGEDYADPLGPDITTAAYEFLSRHTRTRRCA